jgi:fucose 4-O-acetylase-like acetyltransferase
MTKRLLILNGLAILMIPIQHATAYGFQAMFYWTDRYMSVTVPNFDQLNSAPFYLYVILRQLATFSVPAFLFISGFFVSFMARGKEGNVTLNMVLPRIKTLLIPFAIWTVIRYILLRDYPRSIDEILDPYHFIPILCQFYLLSPLLVPLARNNWKLLLGVAAFVHLSIQTLNYITDLGMVFPGHAFLISITPRWMFYGQQPFWFPFGLVFGLHLKEFTQVILQQKGKLLFLTVFFALLAIGEYFVADYLNGEAWVGPTFSGFSKNFFIITFILLVLAVDDSAIPYPNVLSDLGAKSLGIYMANIPAIYVTAVMLYRLIPSLLGAQFLYFLILFAAGIGGPLLLMWLVRNSRMRVSYRYLFG